MASINTGPIVSEIRGKVGEEIFSRNKGGSYVKAYAVPSNPASSFQTTNRSNMADAVAAWNGLSNSDRLAYIAYARTVREPDRLGNMRSPDARSLFISRFLRLEQIFLGGFPSPEGARNSIFPDVPTLTIGSATNMQLVMNANGSNSGVGIAVYGSPYVSQATYSHKSTYFRRLGTVGNYQNLNFNWYTFYNSAFGSGGISVGERVWFRIIAVDKVSGVELMRYYIYGDRN